MNSTRFLIFINKRIIPSKRSMEVLGLDYSQQRILQIYSMVIFVVIHKKGLAQRLFFICLARLLLKQKIIQITKKALNLNSRNVHKYIKTIKHFQKKSLMLKKKKREPKIKIIKIVYLIPQMQI